MASWELSKENIQPLRQGRKVSAMEPQDHRKIVQEQQEFETALRTYSGPDPLEPWHRYIVWVEQTFPKGGKEGNLQQLLEKCIKEFKDDPVQCQDERYLEVWIKYANSTPEPLEIYKFMFSEKIASSRPNFYINWAWQLEQASNYKGAEKVFSRGLSAISGENDVKFLDLKHKQFQARVMKKMLETSEDGATDDISREAAEAEERRTVLASLKGHGKQQKVGSIRVGPAVKKADGPGILPVASGSGKKTNTKEFAIYQDNENDPPQSDFLPSSTRSSTSSAGREKVIPIYKERNRENELEAGKWTQAKLGKKSHAVPIDQISLKPAFSVHVDEGGEHRSNSLTTPHKLAPGESKVLSARKPAEEHDNVAIALFEPPNPMVKPMYCKHLVYQGVTEFSFEELRGIKYRRKKAEDELKCLEEEKQRWKEEQAELLRKQMEAIQKQKEEMAMMTSAFEQQKNEMQRFMEETQRKQKEEFAKWVESEKSKIDSGKNEKVIVQSRKSDENAKPSFHDAENVKLSFRTSENVKLSFAGSADLSIPSSNSKTAKENSSSVLDDTRSLLQKTPLFETPTRNACGADRLVQPSPTINTKEAFCLMQQMWGKSEDSSFQAYEDKNKSKSKVERIPIVASASKSAAAPAPFSIYCDEDANESDSKVERILIVASTSKSAAAPAPFSIYCDEDANESDSKVERVPIVASASKPAASSAPFSIYCDEDKNENESEIKITSIAHTKPSSSTPFNIYCDEPEEDAKLVSQSKTKQDKVTSSRHEFAKPFAVLSPPKPVFGDKENKPVPVQIYCDENSPEAKSKLHPEIVPNRPVPIVDDNITIRVPSMEVFAEMARASSTPFHGRQFLPEEDDNTCNVEIVFKKPAAPVSVEPMASSVPPLVVDTAELSERPNPPALSPILETSRENCKSSSSSSSNASQSVAALTKSQWGNTHMYGNSVSSAVSSSRTPGTGLQISKLNEVSCASGYMADCSARTPGIFLREKIAEEDETAEKSFSGAKKVATPQESVLATAPKPTIKSSMGKHRQVDDDDDEMTGVISDFMKEFQRNAGLNIAKQQQQPRQIQGDMSSDVLKRHAVTKEDSINVSKRLAMKDDASFASLRHVTHSDISPGQLTRNDETLNDDVTLQLSSRKLEKYSFQGRNMKSCSSFINESLKASFLVEEVADQPRPDHSMISLERPTEDWQQQVSGFGQDLKATSFFNVDRSLGVGPRPILDDTDASRLESMPPPTLEMTAEMMSYSNMSCTASAKSLPENPNPFSEELQLQLLSSITRPVNGRHGYKRLKGCVPNVKPNSVVAVADVEFYIMECKGEGGYGKVFKALKKDGDSANETIADMDVVLKLQKPPREWEFYICTELHERLIQSGNPSDRDWFMSIPRCFTYDDGSIFVSEHQSNTLLDVCNQITSLKTNEVEPIAIYFTIEMLKIAEVLKKANIIHADIKPENFLLQRSAIIDPTMPSASSMFKKAKPALQVIDFGVSIDMALFPPGTTFTHCFEKVESKTTDMLEGRPWTYQLDYYCIASVAYTLLHGSYMKMTKSTKTGHYVPVGSLKRWWNVDLWTNFFETLLNIPNSESLPDLAQLREQFEKYFYDKHRSKFMASITSLNTLCAKHKL